MTGSIASLALTTFGGAAAGCNTALHHVKNDSNGDIANDGFVLNEITIDHLQEQMSSGVYTSRAVCELYLKRIDAIDKNGPKLHAVIELNPDALSIADELDRERKAGKIRGAMHGIPVLIKDNINTADKMMTTAGSLALVGNHAATDAFIITQLRAAGAVILGKTNLSEWANFRSSRSTSAWSSRGGQTRMPYILDRNPSGSSSGSGAAVAANLCVVAIGTETDGSVVSPSSVNGLVGIKPTVGLLSRSGIIPISSTQDTAGPMARTVKDAAILLTALAGVDRADAVTRGYEGKPTVDFSKNLRVDALQGKRIGFEKSFLKGSDDMVALIKASLEVLKQQGATVVEIDLLSKLKDVGDAEFTVLLYEFKAGVNQYLAGANARVKSLREVVEFNSQNAAAAMPYFKQETLELALTKGNLDSKEYRDALKLSTTVTRQAIDLLLKDNRLDAIAAPTNGMANCIDLANGDSNNGFSFSSPAACAGYPHITVPMGQLYGLPLGFSFMGTANQDAAIIQLAYAFEQATRKRKAPAFVHSLIPA